jgi:heme A synthase
MSAVRNVLLWMLFGALVGIWVGGLVAQRLVPWINTPGTGIVAQCECHQISVDTVNRVLRYETIGMITGGFAFLVLGLVLGAGRRRRPEPPGATPPAPATT